MSLKMPQRNLKYRFIVHKDFFDLKYCYGLFVMSCSISVSLKNILHCITEILPLEVNGHFPLNSQLY